MQPMTAITLFFMRLVLEEESNFKKRHHTMLEYASHQYQKLFPELIGKNRGQIMLFRFSHTSLIKQDTIWMDLNDFIKK